MKTKKEMVLALLLTLVMVCIYVVLSKPLTSYAAQEEGTKQKGVASNDIVSNYYTEVGSVTKVTAKAFAQNTTDDWTWMGMGNVVNLLYKT